MRYLLPHTSTENFMVRAADCYFYRPQGSWGKVMFLQASVILSTVGGVPDQVHLPDQVHPPVQSMLGDTVNARAVRILLECILVLKIILLNLSN